MGWRKLYTRPKYLGLIEIKKRKTIGEINETKNWFSESIDKNY